MGAVVGASNSRLRAALIAVDAPDDWLTVSAQIRHRHEAALGRVRARPGRRAEMVFDAPQAAITPGQAVVFYDADFVVGGGWNFARYPTWPKW